MVRNNTTRTRLVQIGNSRGVRIPKPLIEQAGLGDEVDLRVEEGAVIIRSRRKPREGWAKAFAAEKKNRKGNGKGESVEWVANKFDEDEWVW